MAVRTLSSGQGVDTWQKMLNVCILGINAPLPEKRHDKTFCIAQIKEGACLDVERIKQFPRFEAFPK